MSEKVLIDRKLLADLLSQDRETRINAERSLYAQLANTTLPQPAAVEVVAWLDEGPDQPDCTASRRVMMDWANNGYSFKPLMTVAQHQRILAAATRPADQVADDLTMVRVPREVLERALQDCSFLPLETTAQCNIDRNAAVRDLRTLLAQQGKAVGDE